MLQSLQRSFVTRNQGHEHRRGHTRQRRVDARLEHQIPEQRAEQEIGNGAGYAGTVQKQHGRSRNQSQAQSTDIHLFGIEQRDDRDGTDIVDDRNCQQECLERGRNARSEKRQQTQRKGDVGRGGNGPATNVSRFACIDRQEYESRDQHAASSRINRQCGLLPAAQLSGKDFSFYFEADEEEKQGHQPVIDPQQERFVDGNQAAGSKADRCAKKTLKGWK